MSQVPTVYALSPVPTRLGWTGRLTALLIASLCGLLLVLAAHLTPSPDGVGTHTGLGLQRCAWLATMGYPCPTCGMTTSFSWFVRGNFLASFYIQPMGFVSAVLATMTFWASLYVFFTGKPAYLLLNLIPSRYTLLPLLFFFIAAWGWKIFIHLHGIDGWR